MSGTTREEQVDAETQKETKREQGAAYINEVVRRAREGDESVLPRLRKLLDKHPELWTSANSLSECALFTWANTICSGDLLQREAIIRDFRLRVERLISAEASESERMQATQVALFHMQLLHAETMLGRSGAEGFTKLGEAVDKRITEAQKRLARAQRDLQALQKSRGVEPVLKPNRSDSTAEAEPDPIQRAAAKATAPRNRQSTPKTAKAGSTETTEVPLEPAVSGTKRVVTSTDVLKENEVPNDSIFSALFENSAADADYEELLNEAAGEKHDDVNKRRQQVPLSSEPEPT